MKEYIQKKILLETKGMSVIETLDYFNYSEWRKTQQWYNMTLGEMAQEARNFFPQKSFGLDE
ncbi:hypothetical protein FACS1894102_5630 [Spirochaetia bacterium]|nr:hypothetical protein FACS1894102_5630 [Spirochaetia bacterium]